MPWRTIIRSLSRALPVALVAVAAGAAPVAADDLPKGKTSGLPLPRFVSIKASPVNVRRGPGMEYDLAWKFLKAGLPVEVTQEFDVWYRIRDSEGAEGWVQKTLLSGKRTALVSPWDKGDPVPLRDRSAGTATVAMVEHRVLVEVATCDGRWCRVSASGSKGWIPQEKLWGVYPDEKFE